MSGDKHLPTLHGQCGNERRYLRWCQPLVLCGGLWLAPHVLALDAEVKGLKGPAATNVANFLAGLTLENEAPAERYEDEIIRRSQEALQAYGYYDAKITLSYPAKGLLGGDDVVVTIDPGNPVLIKTLVIRLEGDAANDKVMKKVVADADLNEGDALRHQRYDSLKNKLTTLSLERGYFDSNFTQHRIEVRPWESSASIYLVFASGQRYRFGDIRYLNSQIELDRVKMMQSFKVGDYYEAGKLSQFSQRLSEAGWFRSVAIKPKLNQDDVLQTTSPDAAIPYTQAPGYSGSWLSDTTLASDDADSDFYSGNATEPDTLDSSAVDADARDEKAGAESIATLGAGNDDVNKPVLTTEALEAAVKVAEGGQVPIDIALVPADRHKFETGIGFSTDVGPRLQFGWSMPWVNRYGHSLNNKLFLSSPEQTFEGEYRMPLADPLKDSYVLEYGMSNTDDDDTESLETTVRFTREWKFDNGWTQRVFFGSTYEDYVQADDSGTVLLLYPGVSWSRARTRPKTFPMWGDRQQLTIEYGNEAWASDVTFLRTQFDTSIIRSLGDNHRFVARMGLGNVSTDNFDDMPPSMRFFTGGDNSVRGYSYESLSPEDDDGDLEGGSSLLTGSLEYDYRVTGDWWGAAFYDAGDAFNGWPPEDLNTAAGMGVRWISPVGPIRLDIAHPFDDDDNDYRIHFSIGPEF
ncbi:autotransporter assembly complex family protein [Cobetia sp. QF-1]|uniref:autotransporter assembly complex protein TamA n=1 Tax=Cobetia sp. QF-1 TaxID=1969833 RepID=UPI001594EAEA|nr:autotransporter assembly complex family protein [Cobetia sp. QF-1]